MAKNKKFEIKTIDTPINENELENITCAFCGRAFKTENDNQSGISFLISPLHKGLGICDVCLDTCHETNQLLRRGEINFVPDEELEENIDIGAMEDYTPKAIKEQLDEYVIGQDAAKRALSIAAYNHIKRVNNLDMGIEKTNVLLVGPTGSGKTYLVDRLSKILKVPCVSINITSFSETGYKGKDPVEILKSLYYEAGENIKLAERGIVFIDEVDKIASVGEGSHIGDTKLQQSLLKMIEGCDESIVDGEMFDPITINTKNILFIFAGAFVGIEKHQKGNAVSTGFLSTNVSSKKDVSLKKVTAENLIAFGMIPEFVGRIQKVVTLNPLGKNDLISIMKNSKDSACVQYKKLLSLDGYNLSFEEDALEEIANECIRTKLGARALKGIIEETMEDVLFNGPTDNANKGRKKKLVVTKKMVTNRNVEDTK